MRSRTYWQDHVLSETNKYTVQQTTLGDDVYNITPYGTVMQQGTFQDADHFNSVEEGLTAEEIAANLALILGRQALWMAQDNASDITDLSEDMEKLHTVETGTVTLTNSLKYPFNNSQKTVALTTARDNGNYVVVASIQSATGNVGEIEITDQLANGFKIAYTGSASSVTVAYKVIGGYTHDNS